MKAIIIAIVFICIAVISCNKEKNQPIETYYDKELYVLNWFNRMQLKNGLVPSSSNCNISLYDNALAAMVFMIYGEVDRAEKILDFFNNRIESEFHSDSGGFAQFRDKNGTPINKHQWMGDNAWLLIAINNYKHLTGNLKYEQMAYEIENWLRSLQTNEGGLNGGYDRNKLIDLQVSEGIIDAFNAVPGYTDFHKKILQFLGKERWNVNKSSLTTGWEAYNYALDLHPWAYCIFEGFPNQTLFEADMYLVTKSVLANDSVVTGYCFDLDKDNIWFEGVGEMIVAYYEAGLNEQADFYMHELGKALIKANENDSIWGIPYVSNGNSTRFGNGEIFQTEFTQPYISSNAWYLFGVKKFNPFSIEKNKMIPEVDKFWK